MDVETGPQHSTAGVRRGWEGWIGASEWGFKVHMEGGVLLRILLGVVFSFAGGTRRPDHPVLCTVIQHKIQRTFSCSFLIFITHCKRNARFPLSESKQSFVVKIHADLERMCLHWLGSPPLDFHYKPVECPFTECITQGHSKKWKS